MTATDTARVELQDFIDDLVKGSPVPGFLAGIWWDGEEYEVATGIANLNTGIPMTTDTAYFPGSITKVLTTTILMRFVERGAVSLDDRVIDHLPELRLGDEEALEALRIVHLVNHTSGTDAADYFADLGVGTDVVRRYVEGLADRGQLFPVGQHISYSNAAFGILGRLLEVLTGHEFNTIMKRELYEPIGMARACTSAEEAILHRTAIGHIVDATGMARPTGRFMMTHAMAPAGTTEILTLNDLLRFARVHIEGGRNAEGKAVLSPESVAAMATPTIREEDMGGQAFGLGWMLPPYGSARVAMHGGGSYGGSATLIVVPEKRFAYAAFGNGSTASALHDRAQDFVLHEILGLPAPAAIEPSGQPIDPARYAGTFSRQYITTHVTPGEDGALVVAIELTGEEHRQLWRDMMGRDSLPPMSVTSLTPTIFVPSLMAAKPVSAAKIARGGPFFLDLDEHSRYRYLSFGGRISRRIN